MPATFLCYLKGTHELQLQLGVKTPQPQRFSMQAMLLPNTANPLELIAFLADLVAYPGLPTNKKTVAQSTCNSNISLFRSSARM